jgi:hypothetical protein
MWPFKQIKTRDGVFETVAAMLLTDDWTVITHTAAGYRRVNHGAEGWYSELMRPEHTELTHKSGVTVTVHYGQPRDYVIIMCGDDEAKLDFNDKQFDTILSLKRAVLDRLNAKNIQKILSVVRGSDE